jgi:dipeptidyl aminopeptidase/acylaminoacyl peptidase
MAASASTACQDLAKDASPTEMVDGTDPPAFIRHSVDETVPIDHARSMRAALDAALVTADYEEIPGSAHALKLKPQEFAETVAFFDRHLLPEGASSVPHLSGIFGTNTGGGSRWPVADLHGRDERADWSPDGEAVVFTSEQGGDPDIHTVEAAGEPPTNISRNAAGDWEPDWSPDGTEVAFTTDRLGSRDIFIMDGDGTDPRPLVRGGAPERNPVWSPDGTKIAFDSRRSTTGTDIYVVNRDGTGLVRLTDTPGDDREPAWSPDGTRIVFSSNRDGDHDIYVMDADGSDAAPLVSGPLEERDPDWGGAPSAGIVPTLSVDDTSVGEPSSGTAPATFTVSLSPPSTSEVTVAYATSNGSAAAGSDFTTSTGTLTFQAGETVRTVSVPVIGDTVVEPHETFYVDLSAPVSATIDDGRGVATILDDDGSCTVRGTPGNDVLDGTAAADVICGFGGGDTLDALGGNDTVDAGSGDDTVLGGEGHDTVAGGTGADRLVGESGNDLLTGGSGADVLQGDGGNDRLSARDRVPGNDSVDGGAGVDRCPADPGDVVAGCP